MSREEAQTELLGLKFNSTILDVWLDAIDDRKSPHNNECVEWTVEYQF
jgi:hypothetical protein